jgi:hypothetical protein
MKAQWLQVNFDNTKVHNTIDETMCVEDIIAYVIARHRVKLNGGGPIRLPNLSV